MFEVFSELMEEKEQKNSATSKRFFIYESIYLSLSIYYSLSKKP